MEKLDEAVYFGKKYGLHVSINMHRIPGYCVNGDEPVPERASLWSDAEMLGVASELRHRFALRYKSESNKDVSFDLVNEPSEHITVEQYTVANKSMVDAIRSVTPDRLIFIEGMIRGGMPYDVIRNVEGCAYSLHSYEPGLLTHHGIGDHTEIPSWPNKNPYGVYGERTAQTRDDLDKIVATWAATSEIYGVGAHVGEFGCYYKAPHAAALAYIEDYVSVCKDYNMGYAMWNFRGSFGIMDNGRTDTEMKDYHGHKLDEKMLKILQKY